MAAFKDHFSARSADYASYRPVYPTVVARHLATLAPSRQLALDCGCGTGQLSTILAERFDKVVAIDASPQQIADAKPHPGVEYRVAPAEDTGLADASADLVTVAQAAHWFALDGFYGEARRVLRPGGVIALLTYGVIELEGEPGRVMAHFYRDVLGPFWPAERRHVETGYRSLPFPFREEPAPPFQLDALWSLTQLLGYVDTWSAVRKAEAALGRDPFDRFAGELRTAWGDPEVRRPIRWPLSMRIGFV